MQVPMGNRSLHSRIPVFSVRVRQGHGTSAVKIEKQGDKFSVKTLWNNSEQGTTFNSPVLKDNLLYGISNPDIYTVSMLRQEKPNGWRIKNWTVSGLL